MRRLAPLLLIVLVAACGQADAGDGRGGGGDTVKSALRFAAHPGAVQFPSDTDWVPSNVGLKALVPVNGCVLGIGNYANGYHEVGANWTGNADCTQLKIDPAPGSGGSGPDVVGAGNGWRGGGLYATAAIAGQNGSVLGIGSTKFGRRDAGGELAELAELRGVRQAGAMARSGKNVVAVGTAFVDAKTTKPTAWLSDNEGATERTVVMPLAEGVDGANGPWSVAADGDKLLAAGFSGPRLQAWASIDGGGSWTVSLVPTPAPDSVVHGILRLDGKWLLFGEANTGRSEPPVLFSGEPGKWSTVDTKGMGNGGIFAGTLDRNGQPVLVGHTYEPQAAGQRSRYCSFVLVRPGRDWQRGELGCSEQPATAVTTLADGRVLIAGNRDLWVRPAA